MEKNRKVKVTTIIRDRNGNNGIKVLRRKVFELAPSKQSRETNTFHCSNEATKY